MPARPQTKLRKHVRAEPVAGTAFLHTILETAHRLREARAFDGSPALWLDARASLLHAIERCGGAPSFADLARLLKITPPAAREQALAAERAGHVELFPCPDDRRMIEVALAPAGRRALEERRLPDLGWLFTLLNGLEPAVMRKTAHVLRVLTARLASYEQDRRRADRGMP